MSYGDGIGDGTTVRTDISGLARLYNSAPMRYSVVKGGWAAHHGVCLCKALIGGVDPLCANQIMV